MGWRRELRLDVDPDVGRFFERFGVPPEHALNRRADLPGEFAGFLVRQVVLGGANASAICETVEGMTFQAVCLVGEMERLARLAHRVIWVNPRSASGGYAPLVGGIAAALPFVDQLVSGHSIAALDDLLTAIAEG